MLYLYYACNNIRTLLSLSISVPEFDVRLVTRIIGLSIESMEDILKAN